MKLIRLNFLLITAIGLVSSIGYASQRLDLLGSSALIDFIQGTGTTKADKLLQKVQMDIQQAETFDETIEILDRFSFSEWIRMRIDAGSRASDSSRTDQELAWLLHNLPESPSKRRIKLLLRGSRRITENHLTTEQITSEQKQLLNLNIAMTKALQRFDRNLYVPKLTPTGLDNNDKIHIRLTHFKDDAFVLTPVLKVFLRVEVFKIPRILKRFFKGNPQLQDRPKMVSKILGDRAPLGFKHKKIETILLDQIEFDRLTPGHNLTESSLNRKIYISAEKLNQTISNLQSSGFISKIDLKVTVEKRTEGGLTNVAQLAVTLPTPSDVWLLYGSNPKSSRFELELLRTMLKKKSFQNLRWGEQMIEQPTFKSKNYKYLRWNEKTSYLKANGFHIPVSVSGFRHKIVPELQLTLKISPESFSQIE